VFELGNRSTKLATRLPNPGLFLDAVARITRAGLDSSLAHLTDLPPISSGTVKSARRGTNNAKANVVVPVVRIVVVTIRRAAIPRMVEPRTTAKQLEVPAPP
jgi:hypothetical protein